MFNRLWIQNNEYEVSIVLHGMLHAETSDTSFPVNAFI